MVVPSVHEGRVHWNLHGGVLDVDSDVTRVVGVGGSVRTSTFHESGPPSHASKCVYEGPSSTRSDVFKLSKVVSVFENGSALNIMSLLCVYLLLPTHLMLHPS